MEEEDWNEFVDDNLLCPDDILLFTHEDTTFTEVRIYKKDLPFFKQVISAPQVLNPKPKAPSSAPPGFARFASASASGKTISFILSQTQNYSALTLILFVYVLAASRARQSSSPVQNPEQYLVNPQNPYFVKTLSKKIDVLVIITSAFLVYVCCL